MKKQTLLPILILLFISQFTFGQITEKKVKMSLGKENALILDIPDVDRKFVGRLWQDYMKDFYNSKPKYNRKENEYFSDDADIVAVGLGNSIDVYTSTEKNKNKGTTVTMWIDLGGAFLNSREHSERYTEAEKILMRFALEVARETTRMEIEEEEKALKKLESELRKLKVANDRYHKEIARAEEIIKRAKENIVQNELDQQAVTSEIENQQKVVEGIRVRLEEL